ncbi:MAG: alginate export family protein [Thermodesulfobacteriota bacterium]|nr:alginate export family protein [Thermodesulfobacteriota bacterium]
MKIERVRFSIAILLLSFILEAQHFVFVEKAVADYTLAEFDVVEGSFAADGEVATRYAYWNWFEPTGSIAENSHDYVFTRTRLGLALNLPPVRFYVQAQDVHMWGLPDDAIAAPPQGPLGVGAIYYLHRGNENLHSTIIRQAYADIASLFLEGLSTRVGRFDYVDGLEVMYKNPKVNWIKKIRLAERLIGPFGWSSFCRSFDGFQIVYDQPCFNLTSTLTHPTQGGFENNAHKTIYEIDLFTLTGTIKYDNWFPNMESRMYYFYYEDDRNISASVDNTGTNVLDQGAIKIHTTGMHWLGTVKTGSGIFDALFWGAYQTGDWGDQEHEAWAADIEAGFQFTHAPWKPWIRLGYYTSSGDSDGTDNDHETFYQILPTARKYALFPFYNMMNNKDLFLQAILKPKEDMVIRMDLHLLSLNEGDDHWYMGAGPTVKEGTIFGYIARPSFGDEDLATVIEMTTIYKFSKNLSGSLYWGHAFGKDVIENIYAGDEEGDYFFAELKIKF